ncbi:hypothetical protein M569_02643, partial [Genlisea aurea]
FFSPKRTAISPLPSPSPSPSPARFGFSPARPSFLDSVLDRSIDAAEPIVMKWNPDTTTIARVTSLFHENRREAHEFVRSVGVLQRALQLAAEESAASVKTIRAKNLMRIAMKRLQKEFYQILSMNRAHLDSDSVSARSSRTSTTASSLSSDSDYEDDEEEDGAGNEATSEVEDASKTAMADLRLIAECMISSGYARECSKIYRIMRKSVVDEGIYRLGFEKFTPHQIQKMDWEALDLRIHNWIAAVRISLQTLFHGERILCDFVFAKSDSIRESCFAEITKDGATMLFGFPEIVAKSRKKIAPEIFRALDMYAVISNQWPEIEITFSSESTKTIRSQTIDSLIKLRGFIRAAVDNFESSIQKHSSKATVPGAGIHPLTIDSMDYLINLIEYSNILPHILIDSPAQAQTKKSFPESYSGAANDSPLTAKITWLTFNLLCKLDDKGRYYRDAPLSYLFLANNLQYIVTRVRSSNLASVLGSEWIANHETKIERYASKYQRLGWGHVVDSINAGPAAIGVGKIKDVFEKFNASFDQAYGKHSACVVPDKILRQRIKSWISNNVFRPYRQFYTAKRQLIEKERYPDPIARYTPDDVANLLSDLFFETVDSGVYSSFDSMPS